MNEYTTPAAQTATELYAVVFRRLLQEQPDFTEHPPTFQPQLAKSYEWSADHKDLTFHMREDAVWSDGVPITADDVRWTWQAQTSPDVAWDSSFMKDQIRDVEVIDPHTVRFHFKRVYAKQMEDANEGAILPRHAWGKIPFAKWRESADWFKRNAVFSGPFVVASWTPQQELVLQRNPRYYDKDRPYLDRVVMRIVPDPASALTQVLSGDVDFIVQVPPSQAPRVLAEPRLRLAAYWTNLWVFVAWNNQNPLFSDPEVRRALTLAIDRKTLVDTILGEYGKVASSPIISTIWAHDKTLQPLPYDPAQARRILESKGWKDSDGDGLLDRGGKPFAFDLTSNAGNQQRNDAAVMIQAQLRKVGIQATPRVLEFNTLVSQVNSGRFDATLIGFALDTYLDLTGNFHSRKIPDSEHEGANIQRYANPEVDRLIEQIAATPELTEARPALDRLQRIIDRDQPVTLLWESQRLSPVNRRVHDAQPNVQRSLFNLQDWWVEPRR
jgi:peptide/nickel transport system substrate-binding protein